MPKLTEAAVKKYTAQKERREIPDNQSGLRLVIQPTGAKSWCMRFRRPNGVLAKLTLGPVELSDKKQETTDEPVLRAPLTLMQARQLANSIHRKRARGVDVVEEHKAKKKRDLAADIDRAANVFGSAAIQYIREYKTSNKRGNDRPRRWRDTASLLGLRWQRDIDPAKTEPELITGGLAATWRDKPLATIDGHDIHTVVEQALLENESRARKLHASLSGMFTWLQRKRRVTSNPATGVTRPDAPRARERVLTDAEIVKFWKATDGVDATFGAALKLLLLTGARRGEVAGMRTDELSDGTWSLPRDRTKNWRPHVVPLPALAREILAKVPKIEGGYIFTTTGSSAISGWSKCKRALDKEMKLDKPWTLHDLRRTAASGMQRLGVRTEVIERALNHVSGSYHGVAGIYQRDPLSDEVRAALLRWSQHVAGLVAGKQDKVVKLRKTT